MELYAGIDLHSNNSVVSVLDENDRVVFAKRLPNDLAPAIWRYLDALEGAFMLRSLQPMEANVMKRLVKSPKVYVRDSGLLLALLDVRSLQQLAGHPVAGALWEGVVIE